MQEDGCQVSVIIRCHNEERWIGHSVQSVIDHMSNPEIVVVDNESTDDSMDICRMFDHHVDMRYFSIVDYSPGKALNLAVQKSKYPHVLILSAHCELENIDVDALRELTKKHACVFGKQVAYYRGRRIGQRYVWSHFGDEALVNMVSDIEHRPFLHNALCFYPKDMLLAHPFDEKLYSKEDRYWAAEIISQGLSTYYEPNMLCSHHWTPAGATWNGIG